MNLSQGFILRPVMTTLVMAALILFGAISYFQLPVNDLPAVDFPTISVSASLPGASPETMATAVATPLEKQFSGIAGIDNMTSSSQTGSTSVTMQFDLSRSIDGAAEDVQAAIVACRPLLPSGMPSMPTFRKANPADAPILFIALSSDVMPMYAVDEYAENILAPRLSMVDGVAQVQVFGSQIYAPRVQVDPRKLAAYGIGIDEVSQAVKNANVNLPTGTLYGDTKAFNVKVNGQLVNAAAFRPIIITIKNGAPVRLSDVATVIDSVQTDKVATWFNNKRAVVLAVQRQPNSNTIEIVKQIRKMLPQFSAILPPSLKMDIMFDRSKSIERSVDDVKFTLVLTILLVVMVIYLFLGNISTTMIAAATLPVSVIGTFGAMKLMGFTINNISLMALTLAVGFVVDDAIVVLENIYRHVKNGEPLMQAALHGSKEVSFTIVSMTVSLVAVFLPILLMGGVIGRLFFQFGATLSVAILISGFVALSLTPMLCSRFLKPEDEANKSWASRQSDRFIGGLLALYERTLRFALHHRLYVVISFVGMLILSGVLIVVTPKGFMPTEDTGQINATTQAKEGIAFEEMIKHQAKISDIVARDPNVQSMMSSVGAGGPGGSGNQGRLMVVLKPLDQRKMKADDIIAELRKKTGRIPGIKLFMQNPPAIRIGGAQSKAMYQLSLSCNDLDLLYKSGDKLEEALKKVPGLADVNSDLQMKSPELNVKIDRDKIAKLGLSMSNVQDALGAAYGARQVSVIYTDTNQYWVILEVAPEFYRDPSMLNWLRIRTPTGELIPLETIATMYTDSGPQQINHVGQFPAIMLSFNLQPGVSLSDGVARVKEVAAEVLPPEVSFSFRGNAQMFESSTSSLGVLLLVSIMVIYITLGILYESYIHPITILTGLPSAALGGLLILFIFHRDLDLYGFLGLILLIGIVKKNAIMMIDFAVEKQRHDQVTAEEAIFEACLVRFRPIMMTTLAAIMGSVPIAIAAGQGAESRQPLGLTIVGGLLVSQIVTLYFTPVFYIYLEKLKEWRKGQGIGPVKDSQPKAVEVQSQ